MAAAPNDPPRRPVTDLEYAIRRERSPQRIDDLVTDAIAAQDFLALKSAAQVSNVWASTLQRLAEQFDWRVVEGVARHRNTRRTTLLEILYRDLAEVRAELERGGGVMAEELGLSAAAIRRDIAAIDRALADARDLPDPGIRSDSSWRFVVEKAALHPRLHPGARRGFAHHGDPIVRSSIAWRPDLSDDELRFLASDVSWRVAAVVAYRLSEDPERIPDLLDELWHDEHDVVHRAAQGYRPAWVAYDDSRRLSPEAIWGVGTITNSFRPKRIPLDAPEQPSALYVECRRAYRPDHIESLANQAIDAGELDAIRLLTAKYQTPTSALDVLATSYDLIALSYIAQHDATSTRLLDHLAGVDRPRVPNAVWDHPDYVMILSAIAAHPRLRAGTRRALGEQRLRVVRAAIAGRCDLSDAEIVQHAADSAPSVRAALLGMLSRDPDRLPEVRRQLADALDRSRPASAAPKTIDLVAEEQRDLEAGRSLQR